VTFNLPNLTADTYTVFVAPYAVCTSTLQITLQETGVGSLSIDGPPMTFSAADLYNTAYMSFFGVAGESVSVAFGNVSAVPSSDYTYWLNINNPDGTSFLYNFYYYSGWYPDGLAWPMWVLPQTGLYTIGFTPRSGTNLTGTATVVTNAVGSLTVGTPVDVSLSKPGQSAMYTFVASAGQNLTVNFSGITTTPANSELGMSVVNSAGTVVNQTVTSGASATLNLTNLAADTYSVRVWPAIASTSTLQIVLQQD
jgi:hypothetical protein